MSQHSLEYTLIELTGGSVDGLSGVTPEDDARRARAVAVPEGGVPAGPAFRGGPVLALGVFDGVHLGHRSLLEAGREMAGRLASPLWVLTFWPHPAQVLGHIDPTERLLLSPLNEKVDLLGQAGAERILVVRFTRTAAGIDAEAFVRRTLAGELRSRGVIVGFNFTFGCGGQGTSKLLCELGREVGMDVVVHPAVRLDRDVISSSAVRAALSAGDVEQVGLLLGRPYSLRGRVVAGAGRGRKLGFPTANISLPADLASPAGGVYVCSVARGTRAVLRPDLAANLPAVANIGTCPTFAPSEAGSRGGSGDGQRLAPVLPRLEVHTLSGQPPTCGDEVRVFFHRRLRQERRFAGPGELGAQIARDRLQAASFFDPEMASTGGRFGSREGK